MDIKNKNETFDNFDSILDILSKDAQLIFDIACEFTDLSETIFETESFKISKSQIEASDLSESDKIAAMMYLDYYKEVCSTMDNLGYKMKMLVHLHDIYKHNEFSSDYHKHRGSSGSL